MCVWLQTMSATTTQCPTCNTRFKVSDEQLETHQGMVRCGRCHAVFNATEFLQDDSPSPQLNLPIALEEAPQTTAAELVDELDTAPAPEEDLKELDYSLEQPAHEESESLANKSIELPETEHLISAISAKEEASEALTLAQKIEFTNSPDSLSVELGKKKIAWSWLGGSLLLVIILLAQTAYFFRINLAATHPEWKPALISYCKLLNCSIPLPQDADLLSIESSFLEADPVKPGVIVLNALLRNHAPYAQAYPQLELTLTDALNSSLAIRTFKPAEYLKPGIDELPGLALNREINVKLKLDTTDLMPSGYRLLLVYP